ncbi:RNA ligase 1 family protein [Nocardia sp. NPDC004573]
MEKIPTLFVRDWDGNPKYVTREKNPECLWVFAGEGVATRKFDGTCVRYDGDRWWARREIKPGKTAPPGFIALVTDGETGKTVGWEPAEQSSFAKFLVEALDNGESWEPGTYELVGPRVNGNPEHQQRHILVPHGGEILELDVPRDYDGLAAWLHAHPWEGVVWHNSDGRMAKLKARDFPR